MKICQTCRQTFNSISWPCPNCGSEPRKSRGFPEFASELNSDVGFKDIHFQELIKLEAGNFWFRARNKLIVWALRHYFSSKENFLEVGCGTGFVMSSISAEFPILRLTGSEISSIGLAYAAKHVQGAQFIQMDARAIPFFEEYDVIGAFDVLEHVEEDEKVLSQLYQTIKPNGGLLITVPQHEFLWSYMDIYACHVRRYSARDFAAKVRAAGFEVVRITSFVSLLSPLMLASRLLWRYEPMAEFEISALTNTLFEKIMGIERILIKLGMSLPVGGSLMIIAIKNR